MRKKNIGIALIGLAFAGASFAQDDIAPFWRAVDSVSRSLGNSANDLYTDLTLLDTIKLADSRESGG